MTHASKYIMLVAPSNFAFNTETAASNAFQNVVADHAGDLQQKAAQEFENFRQTLTDKGIHVFAFKDRSIVLLAAIRLLSVLHASNP